MLRTSFPNDFLICYYYLRSRVGFFFFEVVSDGEIFILRVPPCVLKQATRGSI